MDTTIAGLPIRFWFKDQWYLIKSAEIVNSAAYVEIEPPNAELEAKLKKNLLKEGTLSDTYTLDMANKQQCLLADISAYETWKAGQTKKER